MKTSLVTATLLLSVSLVNAHADNASVPEIRKDSKNVQQPAPLKNARFSGTVEIYVTDWCGYCQRALGYMDSNGIPYVEHNIETDSAAKQRYKELGGRGVPFIIIGSHKLYGFTKEKFDYYMNNSR